ncbi:MAG: hypothetical protein WCR27_02130 [Eubacteriales bacterium]
MLDCKLCNYYKTISYGNNYPEKCTGMCEFTDIVFMEDVENLDIEYPCREMSLADYYNKKKNQGPKIIYELLPA